MTWEAHDGDQLRCVRHGEIFDRLPSVDAEGRRSLAECLKCASDPGPPPEAEDLDADLDAPIDALLETLVTEAKTVEKDLKTLRARRVKAGWVYGAIAKLVDAKTKIWRARMDAARIRKHETQVARREKRLLSKKAGRH